jgi:hypothetical protein
LRDEEVETGKVKRKDVTFIMTQDVSKKKIPAPNTSAAGTFRTDTKGTGNIHPVTCHEGFERKQRYSSILSSTQAVDGAGG